MTPAEFLWLQTSQEKIIEQANRVIDTAEKIARRCPFPKNVRKAVWADFVKGAIIWHKSEHPGSIPFWCIVADGLSSRDPNAQYTAMDGCCYRFHDTYVEVKTKPHHARH